MMEKVLLAYVPVVHPGYGEFMRRHRDAVALYIWSEELISEFPHLAKDIRALMPQEAKMALEGIAPVGWLFHAPILTATQEALKRFSLQRCRVVLPDDDESRHLAAKHLAGCDVAFEPIFLRWDRTKSLAPAEIAYDRSVPAEGLIGEMMARAISETPRAGNWWRQVGAVIAREGQEEKPDRAIPLSLLGFRNVMGITPVEFGHMLAWIFRELRGVGRSARPLLGPLFDEIAKELDLGDGKGSKEGSPSGL